MGLVDVLRTLRTAEGRSVLWTWFAHGREVHQTTPQTAEERYPELFDELARLAPAGQRILRSAVRPERSWLPFATAELEPIRRSAVMTGPLFGPDGGRLRGSTTQTIFRKG